MRELVGDELSAAESLQHANAVDALLDRGGKVASLVLALASGLVVVLLESETDHPKWGNDH